jgi:hypothetical protein
MGIIVAFSFVARKDLVMGRINHRKKHYRILMEHKRQEKIKKLKLRYQAGDPKVKEVVLAKLKKISSFYSYPGAPKP